MGTVDEGPTSCQILDRLVKSQSLAEGKHKQSKKAHTESNTAQTKGSRIVIEGLSIVNYH